MYSEKNTMKISESDFRVVLNWNPENFENIYNKAGLDVAKAEFLSEVKALVGHGISPQKYNQITMILDKYKNFAGALLYIAGLMQTAQGRGLSYKY